MKKQLLIILLLLCNVGLWAQAAYIPFPSNVIIYGRTQTFNSSWTSAVYNSYRTEITGDTLIGAYRYQKLYSGLGPFTVTDPIRNDTLNKKVYLYSVSTGMEKLLYDFNLSVGDTVNQYNGYGFYAPLVSGATPLVNIDTAWVTSIDSVLMNHDGLFHRRFNFGGIVKDINPGYPDIEINSLNPGPYSYSGGSMSFYITMQPLIEGVGQIYNPVSYYYFFEHQWDYTLFCASINGAPLVSLPPVPDPLANPVLCNSIYTSIDEPKESTDFVLYPNPTKGLLQIKTKQQINSIKVTDVFGKQVYFSKINKSETEINISNLTNGIYFVRLSDLKGNSVVKKIVKE